MLVMRWNGQWVGGDRFARDYSAGLASFNTEVVQAVTRFHPGDHGGLPREMEACAAVWAAVLVAFEAAGFREQDRAVLLEALLEQLRAHWMQIEPIDQANEATVLARSSDYFELRDKRSPMKTASHLVGAYLLSIGLPASSATSRLARHLCANFAYRILRDIYRLGAASRLRTSVVSLVERQGR
jgi:hypothetical protein